MKKTIMLLFLLNTYITAQVLPAVAPLNPGNKWVYRSSEVFNYYNYKYEVLDTTEVINGIAFNIIMQGRDLEYKSYMGLTSDLFFVRYNEGLTDSLYRYFKINPDKGNSWEQAWASDSTILYSTITDTFTATIFGHNTTVYQVDKTTIMDGDTTFYLGGREYWTKEFGLIEGRYEQAEDRLIGCVIDGILYGDTNTVSIDEEELLPDEFVLYQNYPNPFNPSTVIKWKLKQGSHVDLKVYDILGREVKTLVNEYYSSGIYEIKFNADGFTSGVYIYRLLTSGFSETKKMILLR